jgi:hypothetical protein
MVTLGHIRVRIVSAVFRIFLLAVGVCADVIAGCCPMLRIRIIVTFCIKAQLLAGRPYR